jgi:hypothetical protein
MAEGWADIRRPSGLAAIPRKAANSFRRMAGVIVSKPMGRARRCVTGQKSRGWSDRAEHTATSRPARRLLTSTRDLGLPPRVSTRMQAFRHRTASSRNAICSHRTNTPRRAIVCPPSLARELERGRNMARRVAVNIGMFQPCVTGLCEQSVSWRRIVNHASAGWPQRPA